jgi:MFS transporter, MHS family, shikimate and dehydroshikimate transport protein
VLFAVGLYVRLTVTESPLFTAVKEQRDEHRIPLLDVLRKPRAVLLGTGVGIAPFAAQSILATFLISYAVDHGYTRAQVLLGVTLAAATALVVLPCAAVLSDRIGRRPVVAAGAVLSAATAFPVFALIGTGSPGLLILACVIGHGIAQSTMYGPLGALLTEMFDTRVRYTGASLGYQAATLIGGGLSPMIASSLVGAHGSTTPVALLLTVAAAVTALTVWRIEETSRDRLGATTSPAPQPVQGAPQ